MAEGSARASTSSAKQVFRSRLRAARADLAPSERGRIDGRIAEHVVASEAFQQAATVFTYLSFGAEVETRAIIRAAWAAGKVVALPRVAGPRELRWYRVDGFDGLVQSAFGMLEPAASPCRAVDTPSRGVAAGEQCPRGRAARVHAEGASAATCGNDAAPDPAGAPAPSPAPDRASAPVPSPAPDRAGAFAPNHALVPASALALVPGLAFDRSGYRLGYGGGFYDAFLTGFAGVALGLCRATALLESLAALGAREPHDVPVSLIVTEDGCIPAHPRPATSTAR